MRRRLEGHFAWNRVMGATGSKLEKALDEQFPEGERYFGLENFGNTCYCNNVIHVLYFCVPFREQLLEYYSNNKNVGDFIGEPVKDLCSPLTIKRSSDGVHITPTIATSTPNVTDSEGFPGRENAMPLGNSFSAENLDFVNVTVALLKDVNILTGGSTTLHRDPIDEAGIHQEMGDHENVIGLKELFSPEHKVTYSSSSFLFNEKETTFSEASPPDPESEIPAPQETPGSVMVVDGHSDEMTVKFLTKSQSVSKYVVSTNKIIFEQSLIPEQKVEECEVVQETETTFVDICTSQLYGSPLCRPFSESVDSRLNAVDLNLLQGTDERRVNEDVLSSDESSFALNIFENEDNIQWW